MRIVLKTQRRNVYAAKCRIPSGGLSVASTILMGSTLLMSLMVDDFSYAAPQNDAELLSQRSSNDSASLLVDQRSESTSRTDFTQAKTTLSDSGDMQSTSIAFNSAVSHTAVETMKLSSAKIIATTSWQFADLSTKTPPLPSSSRLVHPRAPSPPNASTGTEIETATAPASAILNLAQTTPLAISYESETSTTQSLESYKLETNSSANSQELMVESDRYEMPEEEMRTEDDSGMEDVTGDDEPSLDSVNITALRKTIADYSSIKLKIVEANRRIEVLRQEFLETEQQWRNIDWGRSRELEMALVKQLEIASLIARNRSPRNNINNPTRPLPSNRRGATIPRGTSSRELIEAHVTNELLIHEEQIRQLNTAHQVLITSRLRIAREMELLFANIQQLQLQSLSFANRYWLHSDPIRRFPSSEIQKSIYLLEFAGYDDHFAQITSALLTEKLGDYAYAAEICDQLIERKSPITHTAQATKVYLEFLQARRDPKAPRPSRQLIAKFNQLNPKELKNGNIFDRWLLTEMYILQNQWQQADRQLKELKKTPLAEMIARNRLAQIYYYKTGTNETLSKRALRESQELLELTPLPDWQTKTLHGLALLNSKMPEKAIEQLEDALNSSTEDQIPLLETMLASAGKDEKVAWDLFRTLPKVHLSENQRQQLEQVMAEEIASHLSESEASEEEVNLPDFQLDDEQELEEIEE